jgi:hypothetical protein
VPDLARLGFPIAEIARDGSFVMTIHPGQGGLVTPAVLKEQLLYEIGDPAAYLVADVICDITELQLKDLGGNRVMVYGIRGHPPTDTYKVSISCEDGWQISVGLVYTWPDCVAKARASARLVLGRLGRLGVPYRDVNVSLVGYDAVHGSMSHEVPDPNEVYLRMAFVTDDMESADRIGREMITHVLCGVPTSCMLEPGRSVPHRRVFFWPSLVPKHALTPRVSVVEDKA